MRSNEDKQDEIVRALGKLDSGTVKNPFNVAIVH